MRSWRRGSGWSAVASWFTSVGEGEWEGVNVSADSVRVIVEAIGDSAARSVGLFESWSHCFFYEKATWYNDIGCLTVYLRKRKVTSQAIAVNVAGTEHARKYGYFL